MRWVGGFCQYQIGFLAVVTCCRTSSVKGLRVWISAETTSRGHRMGRIGCRWSGRCIFLSAVGLHI